MNYHVFLPPVKKPTGGITVLVQVARHIAQAGEKVSLTLRQKGAWSPENMDGMELVYWDQLNLGPNDVWIVPEGWVNSLAPGLNSGAKCVVYCQNWAYLFSAMPEGVTWDKLPVSFMAVSDPVAWFIKKTTGFDAPIVRPFIDREIFYPPEKKAGGHHRDHLHAPQKTRP